MIIDWSTYVRIAYKVFFSASDKNKQGVLAFLTATGRQRRTFSGRLLALPSTLKTWRASGPEQACPQSLQMGSGWPGGVQEDRRSGEGGGDTVDAIWYTPKIEMSSSCPAHSKQTELAENHEDRMSSGHPISISDGPRNMFSKFKAKGSKSNNLSQRVCPWSVLG